jgi:hypothetical protein
MIVYGDPQFEITLDELLAHLVQQVDCGSGDPLDSARALLIQAGQLEQALADGFDSDAHARSTISIVKNISDLAAASFYSIWAARQTCSPPPLIAPTHDTIRAELRGLSGNAVSTLRVKVPEGFEFYALYPEQYCASALHWAAEHSWANSKRVAAIGIRSIGTSLSALVAATLRAAGWRAHRFTVRPTGDPFHRETKINPGELSGADWALVVDEGPGLSGSSMAAVAQALAAAGFKSDRIAFMPGHDGPPGTAASKATREIWTSTPRYFSPLDQLRWGGISLEESLLVKCAELCPDDGSWTRIEDLGGGLWRKWFWSNEADWPAVPITFERPKYLCTSPSGKSFLWKFIGLGALAERPPAADSAQHDSRTRSAEFGPIAHFRGFMARPWVQGQPLSRLDAKTPEVLQHVAVLVAGSDGRTISGQEIKDGIERLAPLLHYNTKEALGSGMSAIAEQWTEAARKAAASVDAGVRMPCSLGGSFAPHEWIRDRQGRILRPGARERGPDHTIVGKQSRIWDVASVINEWELDRAEEEHFLGTIATADLRLDATLLRFHRLAHAAFRMGQAHLCAKLPSLDLPEQERLRSASGRYREQLARLLTDE